jgi:hypothetical protein
MRDAYFFFIGAPQQTGAGLPSSTVLVGHLSGFFAHSYSITLFFLDPQQQLHMSFHLLHNAKDVVGPFQTQVLYYLDTVQPLKVATISYSKFLQLNHSLLYLSFNEISATRVPSARETDFSSSVKGEKSIPATWLDPYGVPPVLVVKSACTL